MKTLRLLYLYPEVPAEPPVTPLTVPPLTDIPLLDHHCGHRHTAYATNPKTFARKCLPCHQAQFANRPIP